MTARSSASPGPNTRRALATPVEGSKRRKVLMLIAAYIDARRPDPSISELALRVKLPRIAVVAIVDRLERDKLVEVHRQTGARNRYSLPVRRSRP